MNVFRALHPASDKPQGHILSRTDILQAPCFKFTMPNTIEISASSMTGLLGAVEASKAGRAGLRKPPASTSKERGLGDEYNLSGYKKGSSISQYSSKDYLERRKNSSNKGVKLRAERDKASQKQTKLRHLAPSVQEQLAMEALERKAKIYEATVQGKPGGLTDQQLEACPLDVEAKRCTLPPEELTSSDPEGDGCEVTASRSLNSHSALPPTSFTGRLGLESNWAQTSTLGEEEREEEEWVETKDEFGRDMLVPASKLEPRTLDPQRTLNFSQTQSAKHLSEVGARYGPQAAFPDVPLPPVKESLPDEPIEKYFDPKAERRQLGTGFYALSSNPEERQRQQEELRAREAQTEKARAAANEKGTTQLSATQLALESRKRQIQLKREDQMRKRGKAEGSKGVEAPQQAPSS